MKAYYCWRSEQWKCQQNKYVGEGVAKERNLCRVQIWQSVRSRLWAKLIYWVILDKLFATQITSSYRRFCLKYNPISLATFVELKNHLWKVDNEYAEKTNFFPHNLCWYSHVETLFHTVLELMQHQPQHCGRDFLFCKQTLSYWYPWFFFFLLHPCKVD